MADNTPIAWTDATWNPVTGCSKVSAGCRNCYAERLFPRAYRGREFTDVRCHPERLDQPRRWQKPRRIFVNSMSDLFHESVPDDFLIRVFDVMEEAQQHTFQVLTKRAARMCERRLAWRAADFPPKNLWLGVSVEDQATADERIPLLLQTPAALRFLSIEPLLGPVDLEYEWLGKTLAHLEATIDWVIVGGESGPSARACNVEWIRAIVAQCKAAGVACFVKQDSGSRAGEQGRLSDDLWALKEFPEVRS